MRVKKDCFLLNIPFAHRGLWENGIPENSLKSYVNACERGFGIEIDVFLSKDNIPVIFHDDDLVRLTGKSGKIFDLTYSELQNLKIDGKEKIPTLKETLNTVNGKIPLLIEIKNQPNKSAVEIILNELKDYKGEFAIQSFNPLYLLQVKKLRPDILRGILTSKKPDTKKFTEKFVVKSMPFNFLIKPDFISEDFRFIKKKRKKPTILWTIEDKITEEKIRAFSDNFIFEKYIP